MHLALPGYLEDTVPGGAGDFVDGRVQLCFGDSTGAPGTFREAYTIGIGPAPGFACAVAGGKTCKVSTTGT